MYQLELSFLPVHYGLHYNGRIMLFVNLALWDHLGCPQMNIFAVGFPVTLVVGMLGNRRDLCRCWTVHTWRSRKKRLRYFTAVDTCDQLVSGCASYPGLDQIVSTRVDASSGIGRKLQFSPAIWPGRRLTVLGLNINSSAISDKRLPSDRQQSPQFALG